MDRNGVPAITGRVEEARRVYLALTARSAVRCRLHAGGRNRVFDRARARSYAHESALARLDDQIIALARCGAKRAELQRIVLHLQQTIAMVAPEPRDIRELDEIETRIDGLEDRRQVQRLTRQDALPGALLEEAETRDDVAALNIEMSIALRQLAHRKWRSVVRPVLA